MKQINLFEDDVTTSEISNFLDISIEEIFADRFSNYSKYIIQDRALPDVRDGLKPVQRRILYSMFKEGNLYHKQYRKSAKTVGNVIGNYHPHGDSSVYEAMVRMSQTWKVMQQLVIMHGNNGSIDGDSAAAMRYTEAKLSEYSELLVQNLNENTVKMAPNFDDTELEPTVLPTRVPNLLINGASGISAGYATEIPPHNPREVIKAAIALNENAEITLPELMKIVKGPDFPTGAIIQGHAGIVQAYETGKGKIVLKSVARIEKRDIIITQIPYDVNKSVLLQRMDIIRVNNKVDGISEIIDQSYNDEIEIVIKCKKDSNPEIILQYLLKNTDLQKNYSLNMIAISNKRPMQMGLKAILAAFIAHREEVVTKRSEFQLEKTKMRLHIVEAIKITILNIDEVVKIIRKSENKKNAQENLAKAFKFTKEQTEAIVSMQLYRLTNTDVSILDEEYATLTEKLDYLTAILNDYKVLKDVISDELYEVLDKIKTKRKSKIENEIEKIEISKADLIKDEEVIVTMSKRGYIKRTTIRSYAASDTHCEYLEEDQLINTLKTTTKNNVYVFFNDGTYLKLPVHEIPEAKWKDSGKHISSICKVNDGVQIINFLSEMAMNGNYIIQISEEGYTTKVKAEEYIIEKERIKVVGQKTKKDDVIVSTILAENDDTVVVATSAAEVLKFNVAEYETMQVKRLGKKIARLRVKQVIKAAINCEQEFMLLTDKGGYFKLDVNLIQVPLKFMKVVENIKSNPHELVGIINDKIEEIELNLASDQETVITVKKINSQNIGDKYKQLSRDLVIHDITPKINI